MMPRRGSSTPLRVGDRPGSRSEGRGVLPQSGTVMQTLRSCENFRPPAAEAQWGRGRTPKTAAKAKVGGGDNPGPAEPFRPSGRGPPAARNLINSKP